MCRPARGGKPFQEIERQSHMSYLIHPSRFVALLAAFSFWLSTCAPAATWSRTQSEGLVLVAGHGPTYQNRASRWQRPGAQDATAEFDRVVEALSRARNTCQRLDKAYRAACIYTEYSAIAKDIQDSAALAPVARVLRTTADTVRSEARSAQDATVPRVRVTLPSTQTLVPRTSAPLIPVATARISEVNANAAEAIQTAAIQLLRSVPPEDPQRANFVRIASAFNESSVLLRS